MSQSPLHKIYNRARIDDRAINELVGLSKAIVADGAVNQEEAELLQNWLIAHMQVTDNPIISNLFCRIQEMLSDNILDKEESQELLEVLSKFTGGNIEIGELLKSTTLPYDDPPPVVTILGNRFCFTGTFAFGSRRDCEASILQLGGEVGTLTKQTNYLVVGIYATDSWIHSNYGRKIEKAVAMKTKGVPISLIGEEHWLKFIET